MHLLSLSQLHIATIATYLFFDFTGDSIYVEAQSPRSLSSLSSSTFFRVDNGIKRSASATAISSMIPRGGASPMGLTKNGKSRKVVEKTGKSGKNTVMDISENKSVSWPRGGESDGLVPREKLGWAISLVLSVIYLGLLLNGNRNCDYAADGFCVTNYSKESGICPKGDNSHYWSWQADIAFTVAAIVLGKVKKAPSNTILLNTVAIISHGVLHNVINNRECKPPEFTTIASVPYFVFTSFIAYLILRLGEVFKSSAMMILASSLVGGVTLYLTLKEGFSNSPIFMSTQLLLSVVGFFGKPGLLSQLMGDFFVLPCIVAILEFLFCCGLGADNQGFFNKFGGHVWYDVALHTAVLTDYFAG